jgi:hypothetical protein
VGVQNANGILFRFVDAAVDEEGGRLYIARALQFISVYIDRHQIGWDNIGPMDALRINQESFDAVIVGHRQTEMVAYSFVQTKVSCRSQSRSKVNLSLAQRRVRCHSPKTIQGLSELVAASLSRAYGRLL